MNHPLAKSLVCVVSCICFVSNNNAQTIIIGTNSTSLIFRVDVNHQLQVVKEINVEDGKRNSFRESGKIFTGEYLMKEGLGWYLRDALTSSVLEVTVVD